MAKNQTDDPEGIPSPDMMRAVLENEIVALSKATDLRLRELTGIVTAYVAGEITPEEMDKRYQQYTHRWDEALPGVLSARGMTDEEIIHQIDDFPNHMKRLLKEGPTSRSKGSSSRERG
jgi:hypothetical protein